MDTRGDVVFGELIFSMDMVKVIDYLLDYPTQDFSKADLMRKADVGFRNLNKILTKLEEYQVICKTRTISRAALYRLNEDSKLFKALNKVDNLITFESEEVRGITQSA